MYAVISETDTRASEEIPHEKPRQIILDTFESLYSAYNLVSTLHSQADTRIYIQQIKKFEEIQNKELSHIYLKDGVYSYSLYLYSDIGED